MRDKLPDDGHQWWNQLYQGELYKLSPSDCTKYLVDVVNQLLRETFKTDELLSVHRQLSEDAFFEAMKKIRRSLFEDDVFIRLVKDVLISLGFRPGDIAFEPLRLRAIRHNGHLNPRAKAVYYPHRDTWYGHSQSLIVGWLPLHDQLPSQTFEIYPDCLDQVIPNNSEIFNYDDWRRSGDEKKIGWQKKTTGLTAVYPQAFAYQQPENVVSFAAKQAEHLLFSGAHFHKTREQQDDITRFSVDYRFVYLDDHEKNIGAKNTDNRSQGSALQDYMML